MTVNLQSLCRGYAARDRSHTLRSSARRSVRIHTRGEHPSSQLPNAGHRLPVWTARHARILSETSNQDEARAYCSPFLLHLLSPTRICSETDLHQQYLMIVAMNLFLNRPQNFSNVQIFGIVPTISFEEGSPYLHSY